ETPSTNGGDNKVSKTMMIDRSELAKAAYVDGDAGKSPQQAGNIAIGRQSGDDVDDEPEEESATRGVPPVSDEAPPIPPPPKTGVANQKPGKPEAGGSKKPLKTNNPWVTVSHQDHGDRDVQLAGDVTVIAEDGSAEDGTKGRAFANQAYVLLVKTTSGVVATCAGDRRCITVNGKSCLHKALNNGDTV